MKVSIITAILDSPEIVRRQMLHYKKMNLTDDVEIIYVDDGSDPPLFPVDIGLRNFKYLETNDKRVWTQPTARNIAAKHATGETLICTDIDHIVSKEVIELAKNPPADVVRFKRFAAVLDEDGDFTQDKTELKRWGLIRRYLNNGLKLPPHGNSYIINRELYLKVGGVSERYCGTGTYPNREEIPLKKELHKLRDAGKITILEDDTKPILYMMPNGKYCGDRDYNPFGYFHNISRRTNKHKMRERNAGRRLP